MQCVVLMQVCVHCSEYAIDLGCRKDDIGWDSNRND